MSVCLLRAGNEDMDKIQFKVNGISCSVGCEVSSKVTLVDYLRNVLELRGTKYMCREAGCGACIVSAVKCPGAAPVAVNSCLVSVTSCQGWEITTIEKVGNRLDGYHPVQMKLAEYNGTQCGHCTPGWVMSMYSLLQKKKDLTMLEVEKSFGSNVCRCTGYRPIMEAYKTFAKDSPVTALLDIEDLNICKKTGKECKKDDSDEEDWCVLSKEEAEFRKNISIKLKDGKLWFTVSSVLDIFKILFITGDDSYMLVSGNTAKGAYPIDEYPHVLIDISGLTELKGFLIDQNLIIGAGNTLTEVLDIFENISKQRYFSYLQKLYDHIELVAHIPVRNLGSMAGNLMIKHQHNEFPSDIFLLLETVGAQLSIINHLGIKQVVSMQQFLKLDMRSKVILNAILPPYNDRYKLVTFKIMPRAQSAHAIVNAGFLYKLKKNDDTVQQCRLVFGGLSPSFSRAHQTENCLIGKSLFTNDTLQTALSVLENDLVVTEMPPEPSVAYRKKLALALFYKGLLVLYEGKNLASKYKSGAVKLHESRPVSDGRQIFETNPSLWPLNQPLQKVEALHQCSGEAEYTEDIPSLPREVFAAFVLSTVPSGNIDSIDSTKALSKNGVLAFYTAKDIPGINSFTPPDTLLTSSNEEVLCDGQVKYYNQPVGIIVAESRQIAEEAVKLVKVKYSNVKKPVFDIKEAKKDSSRLTPFKTDTAKDRGTDVVKVLKGSNNIYGQYHMCMETLVCITRPSEQGLEVHSATQWLDGTQLMISRALNMDVNSIDVYVTRLGGAYGFKISRSIQVAISCSLVAKKLNRPCRFIQTLTTNMRAVGKRYPCSTDYEMGLNASGEIQYINYQMFEDNGYKIDEKLSLLAADLYYNCYRNDRWNFNGYDVITDIAKNTFCRSPGTLEAISMCELLMEHISYAQSLDPLEVRLANLNTNTHGEIREMLETLKINSQYEERKTAVTKFNRENRWKKRGLRISFSRWTPLGNLTLDINLSVYHGDGTIAITHSGVEMGQGVNTIAVQVCAYLLKISVDKIKIKGNNTIISPNAFISGGSLTTQNVNIGVQRCCQELLRRLEPIRQNMNNPSWEELIKEAYNSNVDLQTHGFVSLADTQTYDIYGVACAEVEVDILTGESEVIRIDLLQDVGRSVNPEIDIGQVEGAFVMGLGYWTCEKLVYDPNTGELLTDRTWNYYVPQARDIPQDFRVYFKKKSFSNELLLGSKATGEPPICLSVVIALAIREAVVAARLDSGIPSTQWYPVGSYESKSVCWVQADYEDMDRIEFKVNGISCSVGSEVSSKVKLLDYIRDVLQLRGTKYMCRHAGCGACIVSAVKSPGAAPVAVNSCVISAVSCHGWEITTIEKVGNRLDGYHPLQKKMAEQNATQCGYCTPGWIMSMYSLLQKEKDLTMLEVEKSFGSNLCRCTGYRAILDAFKSFAKDSPVNALLDIEDLNICKKTGKKCKKDSCAEDDWCVLGKEHADPPQNIAIKLKDGKLWFKVFTTLDIFKILSQTGDDSYMLVSGNTAKDLLPIYEDYPHVLIDISGVTELKGYTIDQNLIVGAGNTITEILEILKEVVETEYFGYLKKIIEHFEKIAHIPIRNLGSMAGNLMMKHQNNGYNSDIFLLLEVVGAQLSIINNSGIKQIVSMEQFLTLDMKSKVILNAILPPFNDQYKIVTFKVIPRAQSAGAVTTAGFLYKLKNSDNTVEQCKLVFGGMSPSFSRAYETEKILVGKPLFTNETLQTGLSVLEHELVIDEMSPSSPSVAYRKKLALGLFYKGLLALYQGNNLANQYKSGAIDLHATRPVSTARQVYETNPALWPLNQPLQKVEALHQCSGEAEYTEDIPSLPREVFATFVLATVPRGKIESIDTTEAMSKSGVLAFYTAKDIPGVNSFIPADTFVTSVGEEVLCDGEVKHFNQPIGIIVAETREEAEEAAKLVKVEYSDVKDPIFDIKEAKKDPNRLTSFLSETATNKGSDVTKVLKGSNTIYGQYHFTMEPIVCVTRPSEQGLEVHAATQWLEGTQLMIAKALNMDVNSVDVYVTRLGGGLGIKISRSTQIAVACSLVAKKLNKPCRFIQSLDSTMRSLGKRFPCSTDYEMGLNASGEIQYLNYQLYEDNGYILNEKISLMASDAFSNCYKKDRWNFDGYDVITDITKNTHCRSPGTLEAISMCEIMMDHISYAMSLDPIEVRLANLDTDAYGDLKEMIETLKANSNFEDRKTAVTQFNKNNRWKKRGLRTSFSHWTPLSNLRLDMNMAVYRGDGTVVITHSGVEMGQGVNTIAVQVCAYMLKISVDKIKVKGNNTIICPNAFISGGSLTTQNIIIGVQKCCHELLMRLEPIREKMNNPTWEELIQEAYDSDVSLQTHGYIGMPDTQTYSIYGVACAEVEIDVLTGETEFIRVDILQDVGRSVNPAVDIGQVEGAFVMGLGYWTCEKLVYDPKTGELLTDNSGSYHVPQARDIPQDFRIYLRKKSFGNEILLGSKATGEPPMCLSVVVALAIREAVVAARLDSGIPTTQWYAVDGPCTTESICLATETKIEDFKFN